MTYSGPSRRGRAPLRMPGGPPARRPRFAIAPAAERSSPHPLDTPHPRLSQGNGMADDPTVQVPLFVPGGDRRLLVPPLVECPCAEAVRTRPTVPVQIPPDPCLRDVGFPEPRFVP